ncbi:C2H2 finger domain transcription factor CON7 [Fusarium oxysporum f. sp. rapae]|uniref:C2H2 finger domain transcription factor CON7 n=1 Tax=Fusarium oxysporum f. sp. rapae TaxID=485398 RepID=A0A8J5NH31_FUSOX|nr:C2H2 finger domain transcription factor CON7 [Fusarium oxysporum f. sp. rapae]
MEVAQSGSQADHTSVAQYPVRREVNYSTSSTPTSNYDSPPKSAASGSFLENVQRSYHLANGTRSKDGCSHQAYPVKSDNNVPTDPSIVAPNTTYASYGQHSTHASSPEITRSYSHRGGGIYAQPQLDRPGYVQYGGTPLTPGPPAYAQNPASMLPQSRINKAYPFVHGPPVPGKRRPRRHPDKIDRIYKCGWNGCEKAYGTLNHLNAHVTMQSHGQRRTPDEFKKIREEWKQRKKKEEANRHPKGERQRQAAAAAAAQIGGGEPRGQYGALDPSYIGQTVQMPFSGYQVVPQQHFTAN